MGAGLVVDRNRRRMETWADVRPDSHALGSPKRRKRIAFPRPFFLCLNVRQLIRLAVNLAKRRYLVRSRTSLPRIGAPSHGFSSPPYSPACRLGGNSPGATSLFIL